MIHLTSDIARVQASLPLLRARAPRAAAVFCEHLLVADPGLRGRLAQDPLVLGARAIEAVGVIASLLEDPERLFGFLRSLTERCAGGQTRESDHLAVIEALDRSLVDALGPDLLPEWRAAWRALAQLLSRILLLGAQMTWLRGRATSAA